MENPVYSEDAHISDRDQIVWVIPLAITNFEYTEIGRADPIQVFQSVIARV